MSLMAQTPDVARPHVRVPLVTDWSHKTVIYSAPKTIEQSWRLQREPRYMQQYYRRASTAAAFKGISTGPRFERPSLPAAGGDQQAEPENGPLHRDWTAALGETASVGNDQFPAKFSFDVNATPNCTSDFVAYNTNTAAGTGATGTGYETHAYDWGFFYGIPYVSPSPSVSNPSSTFVIAGVTFTAISNTATVTSAHFRQGSNPSQAAYNFMTAVNTYHTANASFTYTAENFFGNWVLITDTVVGVAGNNTTVGGGPGPSIDCFPFFFWGCSNPQQFTWGFGNFIGGRGGSGISGTASANIVALNNLYSSCGSGTAPSTYFAYGTSTMTGGLTSSSVALSMDGTKLAFVESTSTGSALHILKWKAGSGTITAPATPITASSSENWATCVSCEVVLAMGKNSSSNSAPFVDYTNDAIYVGDDNGVLYKFSGAFLGVWPAKSWSVTVDSGAQLTGPVYDGVTGNVFMADSKGCVSYVATGGTSPVAHGCKIPTGGNPIPDPPIVDSNAQRVMVFVGNDGTEAEIIQADTSLNNPTTLPVGAAGAQMHAGDFDNTYYSGDTAQGYLYYCGKQITQDLPTIRRISFDASGNFIGSDSVDALPVGLTLDSECSPMTEVYNNGMDMMFFGVTAGGNGTNCGVTGAGQENSSGGCLMSINVTNGVFPTAVAASLGEPGGTSGIVVDNVVSSNATSGSSVYFTPLTVGTTNGACTGDQGCAVKATQNGLN